MLHGNVTVLCVSMFHHGIHEVSMSVDKSNHHVFAAGDGNCAYRALLMGLLEAAVAADDYTRQSLVQQVKKLRRELPVWASSSFDASSNVAYGYDVLMVRSFCGNQCLHGI